MAAARKVVDRLEEALGRERDGDGPFFNGPDLSLVDAAYAPFLQRFAIVEDILQTGLLADYPLVSAWSDTLLADKRVQSALPEKFPEEFRGNLERRNTLAWQVMNAA